MAALKPITALKKFFGLKEGQTLAQFSQEVKQLSRDEQSELARLACAEMGDELEVS